MGALYLYRRCQRGSTVSITSEQPARVRAQPKHRFDALRTSHIQNASILFLGGGSSYLFVNVSFVRARVIHETERHTRHCIEFGHVADKVHFICSNGGQAHEELGRDVEHGKEYDREVVGHERGSRPVSLEKDFPSAELEERKKDSG